MRDLFSVVAASLVVVLCAALAVPYFVDWESRRAQVEAALGRAFGAEVRTEGAVTVRLLPTPRLELERVSVGGDAPFLTADGLSVALEAPPLIGGRIEVTSARLVRPTLQLMVDGDGALRLPARIGAPLAGVESAGVARLEVEQGTIRVAGGPEGAAVEHVVGPFDASASAQALAGPWRIDGRYGRYALNAATGAVGADGRVRMKLRANDSDTGAHADFDGYLSPQALPAVSGRLALSMPLPQPAGAEGNAADRPRIAATADLAGEGWRFDASGLEIRSGEGAGAVVLTGAGTMDAGVLRAGGVPRVALDLDSRRLDVRPLVAAWTGGEDDAAAVRRLLGGLPVDVTLDVGSVAYGGEEFGAASLVLRADPGPEGVRVSVPRLDLALPGGGSFTVEDGLLGAGADFAGTLGLVAGDSGRLANALKDTAGSAATVEELGLIMRLSQTVRDWPGLSARGHVEVSQTGLAVRSLAASAGESTLSGDLTYTRARDGERARADARLGISGVDLEALPRLDPMTAVASGVDVDVALEARRLRFGAAPASEERRFSARFRTTAEGMTIERFDLTDPDGARVSASGHFGEDGGRITATMEADDPAPLIALYRPLLPARWGELLARATPAIAPLKLEATIARPDATSPLVAVVKGNAARTAVDGRLVSDPGGAAGDRALIDLRLASPDAADLLAQLGLGRISAGDRRGKPAGAAPGELVLAARGNSFARLDGRISLDTPAGRLVLDGQWLDGAGGASLSGPLRLDTADAGALAALLRQPLPATPEPVAAALEGALQWRPQALAVEDITGVVAGIPVTGRLVADDEGPHGEIALERLALGDVLALVLGPGARPQAGQTWSSRRLGEAAPTLAGSVALSVKQFSVTPALTLNDALLRVAVSPQAATLAVTEAGVEGGGRAGGEIALQRLGAQVNLRGGVTVREVPLSALVRQPVAGVVGGRMEFGAAAESVAGLVANLAGGGEARVIGAAVPGLDPAALARAVAHLVDGLVDGASVEIDPARVAARLAQELDGDAWPLDDLAVPLTLASGTLRFGPLALAAGQARAGVSGSFDLGGLTLDARAHLSEQAAPEGWSGAPPQAIVVWQGPLDDIERRVDAGGVANGLAAISLTRELDRIERLEAEARDRIEQARRAREERARREEQERREAETRRAEEARAEAARVEAERAAAERAREERAREERAAAARAEAEREEADLARRRLEALARDAAAGQAPVAPFDLLQPPPPGEGQQAPLDIRPDARDP